MKLKSLAGVLAVLSLTAVAKEEAFDVVIYGSSPAALTAAIEAQKHGKTAVIVCPETRIGGLTTGGLGQTDIGNKSAFGGLALQFYKDVADYYKDPVHWKYEKREDYVPDGQCAGSLGADSMWTFEPHAALEILEGWAKKYALDIRRGEYLVRELKSGVEVEEGMIKSIKTLKGNVYKGKMFVDATYEGDLMAAAGCSYMVGREANSVYGETISGIEKRASKNHQFEKGVDPFVVAGDPASGLLPMVEPFDPNEKDGDGDKRVQAYCFRMCLTDDPSNRIPFAKPEGYDSRNYELLLRNLEKLDPGMLKANAKQSWKFMPWINSRMPNRKTDTNNRTGFSTDFVGGNWKWPEASYEERAKILKAHLDYQRGLMWTLANDPRVPTPIRTEVAKWGTCKDEFQDGLGLGWQSQLYVREARRLVGDMVMTEHHCRGDKTVTRPIGMGAYGMDSHNVRRHVGADGFVRNEGNVEDYNRYSEFGDRKHLLDKDWRKNRFPPYSVDYGAIIPKKAECGNLFVPVCLSASHMAFGSIRMEPVFFAMGQVAGAAASLAIGGGCAVQDLAYPKLRKVLLDEGQVIERPCTNKCAETVFLETEAFADWGGWVNDTQFMGTEEHPTPYLLAHGLGKPVADAMTKFKVASPGKFAFRVRTQNWTGRWSDSAAGTFKLLVDGQALPETLGAKGKGEWTVELAGTVDLAPGEHTLALKDLTGFDGRCDWVHISTETDEGYQVDLATCTKSRRSRRNLHQRTDYDLVVVGGGIAGICTSISAARLGLKVALIQDRSVLGGNNSSEVRVHLGAWQNMPPYPRLGDIVAEIGPAKEGNAESAGNYEDERKLKAVRAEKNIELFLNMRVMSVCKDGEAIRDVHAVDTRTGKETAFYGKWFVDCTGDGTVGFLAGADYRQGREARSVHGEPWAPEKEDMLTMGASVQWYAGKVGTEKDELGTVEFPKRPWMVAFNEGSASRGLKGDWWWEAGLGRDQIKEAEYIRDYGLLVAYSNWAFLKNESARKAEYVDKELKWVAYNAGRRESRRLLGDFILTENDLMNKNFQPDGTCATTWTIDLHFPKAKEETKFEGEAFQSDSLNHKIWPYPIPYRCYYSRNISNLFMAGRDISVSHVALGTTRLMRTHGMMGEVVGMAASLCKKHACNPRQIYTDHLDELKALMEKGVGDGKVHPRQMYNIQDSLNPDFKPRKDRLNHQLR